VSAVQAGRWGSAVLAAVLSVLVLVQGPAAASPSLLAPLAELPGWVPVALPAQKLPPTRFDVVEDEGQRSLRIASDGSYGNLVHELPAFARPRTLQWRWRLDEGITGADLKSRATDDAAVKVCVLFDLPDERLPFVERQLVRMARAASGQKLPGATLCYVWAPLAGRDELIVNAYTRRMRWLVLQGRGSPLAQWRSERRDLRTDFLRAFGNESAEMPPVQAVLVGADADNTGGRGLALVQALELLP
jgi:hypothetical protein